ncbi:MAG: DUF1858 domain-containing protein [Clostridia bacterium]|nr:DUF1858 domain-containing protein [Clostridia bacterium]
MAKVTKDMIVGDVVAMNPNMPMVFIANGLFCYGCPSASGETLEDACAVHGIDCDKLLADINASLEE